MENVYEVEVLVTIAGVPGVRKWYVVGQSIAAVTEACTAECTRRLVDSDDSPCLAVQAVRLLGEVTKFDETATAENHVDRAIGLARRIFAKHVSGGPMHIAIYDGNLDDNDIAFCAEQAAKAGCLDSAELCSLLAGMNGRDRVRVYEGANATVPPASL